MRRKVFKVLSLASALAAVITVFFVGTIKVSAIENEWWILQYNIDDQNVNVITLNQDVTAPSDASALTIPEGRNIIIDLNGHTLNRNLTEPKEDGCVICVEEGATLTVKDSSQSGTGVITGGYNDRGLSNCGGGLVVKGTFNLESGTIKNCKGSTGKTSYGGGVSVEGNGTFNMSGGCIDGCKAGCGGGVGIIESATVNMTGGSIINCEAVNGGAVTLENGASMHLSGGEIKNNSVSSWGAGIYICSYGDGLEMTGGKIVGNHTDSQGGGVYCEYDSKFVMYGGEITENSSQYNGGGLCSRSYSDVILGGTAKITGNTVANQPNNAFIVLISLGEGNNKPKEGFNVGVNLRSYEGVFTNNSAEEDTIYFFADDGISIVRLTSDKKYELVKTGNPNPGPGPKPNNNDKYYTPLENEIIATESGRIKWNEGTGLPYSVLKELANKPSVTVEFTFTYQGVEYTVVISSQDAKSILDETIPWYGPAKLLGIRSGNAGGAGYVVKEGDTLNAIAAANHTTVDVILRLNPGIKNPNLIFPGDRIVLP